jgi:hypothetical protein
MNHLIQNWLDNPRLSLVQACCFRSSEGVNRIQLAGPDLANEQVDLAINSVASVVPLLTRQQLLPGQVALDYSNGRLYYVVRPDGAALGIFCKLGTRADTAAVYELITDFLQSD